MSHSRLCSRQGCSRGAVATLTFVYADSTVVVGPLAVYAEPHGYDLCEVHSHGLTVPRGWDIIRLDYATTAADEEGLLSLHKAVTRRQIEREQFSSEREQKPALDPYQEFSSQGAKQRNSLRALGSPKSFVVAKPEGSRRENKNKQHKKRNKILRNKKS